MIPESKWKWFGHAAHLCVGRSCQFHLATLVGKYLVSTVGEYWPDRQVREIHAEIYDRKWLDENVQLKGDDFDSAYTKKFGFEEVGCNRKYETMVFLAGTPCNRPDCRCGLPEISGEDLDFGDYNTAKDATEGHMKLCKKWVKK